MQPLICVVCSVQYWVSCAINKGGFFEIAFVVVVVDTHLPQFDALTHLVIRVSSAFIFQTFAKASVVPQSKSILSCVARRLWCHRVNLPSCVATK